jgi:hypothetical protein
MLAADCCGCAHASMVHWQNINSPQGVWHKNETTATESLQLRNLTSSTGCTPCCSILRLYASAVASVPTMPMNLQHTLPADRLATPFITFAALPPGILQDTGSGGAHLASLSQLSVASWPLTLQLGRQASTAASSSCTGS